MARQLHQFNLLLGMVLSISYYAHATAVSGMFDDWLAQQQTAVKARLAYSGVETTEVCLQEVIDRNCRCINTNSAEPPTACLRFYVESMFSCCGGTNGFSEVIPVAQCSYSEDYFDEAISYTGTTATKIGVFTAVCTMREGIHKCHDDLTEGMTVTVDGSIMRYSKIAFVGHPSAPTQDQSCKTSLEGPLSDKKDFASTGSPNALVKPAAYDAREEEEVDDFKPDIYTGEGDVYLGDLWVSNGAKHGKFDTGRFQLVYVRHVSETPVSAPPDNHFVAKPYAVLMQLQESESRHAQH